MEENKWPKDVDEAFEKIGGGAEIVEDGIEDLYKALEKAFNK